VIKIRYASLPAGLHVRTVVEGRHTVLYLLPGLTTTERRAAIGRARSSARVGYGPPLPARGMAAALLTDQIRSMAGNGYTALRVNPAFFVPVGVLVASVAVAFLFLGTVSIQFRPPENAGPGAGQDGGIGVVPGYSQAGPGAGSGQRSSGGHPGHPGSGQLAAGAPGGRAPGHGGAPGPAPRPSSRPTPSSPASPQPTGSAQMPGQPPATYSPPAPSPTPSPTSSPSPTATGICMDVGPLDVCLN
jgi:hypothetical protein